MFQSIFGELLKVLVLAVGTISVELARQGVKYLRRKIEESELMTRLKLDDALLAAAEEAVSQLNGVMNVAQEAAADGKIDTEEQVIIREHIERALKVFARTHGSAVAKAIQKDMAVLVDCMYDKVMGKIGLE